MQVVNEMQLNYFKSNYTVKNATIHLKKDRISRFNSYFKNNYKINYLNAFIINNNHKNGLEVHAIDKNGFIFIFNFKSKKFITVLSANAYQIKRYYKNINDTVRKAIETSLERNKKYNFNNI